ncbi:AraC family transcriptional regulator [uncultured Lacinutrix sp.]|uniref:helix-turn-helix domain-containing protein n=1 Tax=uncultured Lacinutrix sp. TaxID=574032 RepID=UPI00260F7FF7|nr:helix-turn-helix domain-containing protein [uncultured Lacinutrix sp.]
MEINYNIISLIDTLGLLQGLILGILLIVINRKKNKSTLFLGFFIIAYALDLLPVILDDLGVLDHYPEYILLPFKFTWLLYPLFYIYVQQVSIFSNHKKSYKTLIPGILILITGIIIFFQPLEVKKEIEDSLWYELLDVLGIFYSIGIGILTIKWIKKHIAELKNQYASVEYKVLQWARVFVFIGLIFTTTFIISAFFDDNYYFELIISIINVVLLYWVSMRGILQQNIALLFSSPENNTATEKQISSSENSQKLLEKINDFIVNNSIFIKPDLTILDISEGINVHPKRISRVINANLNQNFNTYINSFRIEKAKRLLNSETVNNLSIEGIGKEVGFQSKSTFYDAFKKVTGTTPSRYKSQ